MYHQSHHPRPLVDPEAYDEFINHNKHLMVQIKTSVIFFIGGIVILVCMVYIVLQCKTKVVKPLIKQSQDRKDSSQEKKPIYDSTDTLDNLLPSDMNCLPLKMRKDREFFVWCFLKKLTLTLTDKVRVYIPKRNVFLRFYGVAFIKPLSLFYFNTDMYLLLWTWMNDVNLSGQKHIISFYESFGSFHIC